MDREALSLPNSQFYTNPISSLTSMLSPIAQSSEKDSKESLNTISSSGASSAPTTSLVSSSNTTLFELTEEVSRVCLNNQLISISYDSIQLTPKRPLRSEVEKEKRLSRTQSIIASAKNDNASMSGESSNSRNSISKILIKLKVNGKLKLTILNYFSSYNGFADIRRRFSSTASAS
jgi:dedicator of cytokinesis protein 1